MSEAKEKNVFTESGGPGSDEIVFEVADLTPVSSAVAPPNHEAERTVPFDVGSIEGSDLSQAAKALAVPKLPPLSKQNRARLQMQSPNRLFFYWSLRNNPYQILHRAFGDTGSYTLVARLLNLSRDTEEMHAVDADGSFWFAAEANSNYRAEIGFYAPNRPYVRIVHSNTIATPRKSPSSRPAADAEWRVTAARFARVLDVSGFKQDAYDVALAGDDLEASERTTRNAFAGFLGKDEREFDGVDAEDIRYALLALASGYKLEQLRWRINATLFAILQASAERLSGEQAMAALRDHFGVEAEEITEEELGSAVYGASLVNFPRRLKKSLRTLPKLQPVSSPGSQYHLR